MQPSERDILARIRAEQQAQVRARAAAAAARIRRGRPRARSAATIKDEAIELRGFGYRRRRVHRKCGCSVKRRRVVR